MITQMTLINTLKKKNQQSIVTKILLQINAKVGNILWSPRPPKNLRKTMIIGIDHASDKVQKGTIVSYVANMDNNFGIFYSDFELQA